MRQKRFSLFQMLLAVVLTAAVVLAAGAVVMNHLLGGAGGRSLLEAWRLINTRFVGEYDGDAVVDGALEGMVAALGDRWSYTLTEEELAAQNQRRTNQYVGIGVTVSYENEAGLEILEVTPGGPAEAAGLRPGEVLTADFADVTGFDISLEGQVYTITSKGSGDDKTFLFGDEELDISGLEIALTAVNADEFTDESPSQKEELGMTVTLDSETHPKVQIEFYRYDGEHCLAVVDGTPFALVPRSAVVDLIEAVNAIVL